MTACGKCSNEFVRRVSDCWPEIVLKIKKILEIIRKYSKMTIYMSTTE